MQEIDKSDVKVSVIPNGLERYMVFTINKNLFFIDSMQFMNSSLDSLVKNLSDNDFEYLFEDSFKNFSEYKLPDKCKHFSSVKNEDISEKDYLAAIDVWNVFKMNTMGDYHDLYFKSICFIIS